MKKTVLIVDDDSKLLASLRDGLKTQGNKFQVITALDGKKAIKALKVRHVSVVVTDLKMPEINGINLLSYLSDRYPDIPVIVMTGYGSSKTEELVRSQGAVDYLKKPFSLEDLVSSLNQVLKKQTEGGELHNVSPAMFLQLLEIEQRTCTVRVVENKTMNQGALFFKDGSLVDARLNGSYGEKAAYEILSWEQTSLSIENRCWAKKKRIGSDLQALILEAMRLKDEKRGVSRSDSGLDDHGPPREGAPSPLMEAGEEIIVVGEDAATDPHGGAPELDGLEVVKRRLAPILGSNGFVQPYRDSSWNSLVAQATRIGAFFEAGDLKAGFVNRNQDSSYLLVPGHQTIVVKVEHDCPRDRLLKTFCKA